MVRIKRTNSSDKDFRELIIELDKDLWSRYGTMQLEYQQYNIIEDLPTVVVVYTDERPVGCGCFKYFEAGTVELKRMFVAADHRGKGIGAAIINELESWAKELNVESMVLETAEGQPEAIHLYKKSGYTIIPNYHQYIGKEKSICMKKVLV